MLYHKFVSKPVSRVLITTFCIFVAFFFIMHVVRKKPFIVGASDTFLSRHLQPVTVAKLLANVAGTLL